MLINISSWKLQLFSISVSVSNAQILFGKLESK